MFPAQALFRNQQAYIQLAIVCPPAKNTRYCGTLQLDAVVAPQWQLICRLSVKASCHPQGRSQDLKAGQAALEQACDTCAPQVWAWLPAHPCTGQLASRHSLMACQRHGTEASGSLIRLFEACDVTNAWHAWLFVHLLDRKWDRQMLQDHASMIMPHHARHGCSSSSTIYCDLAGHWRRQKTKKLVHCHGAQL